MSSKISLYNPHDKQKLIHSACSVEDPCFYVVAVAGRRAGKSMAALNQILFWAFKYNKCKILYITPSDEQGGKVIDDILSGEGIDLLIKSKKNSKGSREIILTNDSKITFKGADSSSIRGLEANFVVIDEAAYLSNKVFDMDIMPTMATGGKKCLIISTPKGKNWFYNYYLKGLDETNKDVKSFKFLSTDNPLAPTKLIQMFKESVPEAVFRQEYEACFEDSAGVFRNIEQVCVLEKQNNPLPGINYYAGCDIGLLHDDTTFFVIDNNGNTVFQDRFTGVEAPELRQRLLSHLRKWKPLKCLIEENNQGLPLIQDLKRDWPNITGFKTTNSSKEEIVNKLVSAFSGLEIRCINDEELILQLNSFIFEMTSSGKIRYCAAQGFHDDLVMGLALAWNAFVTSTKMGGYHLGASEQYKKKSNLHNTIFDNAEDDDKRWNGEDNNEFIFFGSI